MGEPAEVVLSDGAKGDLRALLANEDLKAIGLEALRKLTALESDPYLGDKLRAKANRKPLAEADCRKVKFDDPDRASDDPARYRIVYRLEPFEGSPHQVYVVIVALKRQAYGEGAARAVSRLRELARERAQERLRSDDG